MKVYVLRIEYVALEEAQLSIEDSNHSLIGVFESRDLAMSCVNKIKDHYREKHKDTYTDLDDGDFAYVGAGFKGDVLYNALIYLDEVDLNEAQMAFL